MLAGAAVARERHTRTAVVTHVAVHHRDDVDRRSQTVGDAVHLAVILRTPRVPALEHRFDRAPQLLLRIIGEGPARALLDDRLEVVDQVVQIVGGEIDVAFDLAAGLRLVELCLERILAEVEDDVAIHLDEAAITIPSKAVVVAIRGQGIDGLIV